MDNLDRYFEYTYHRIIQSLDDFDLPSGYEEEVAYFLHYITLAYAGKGANTSSIPLRVYLSRIDLYGKVRKKDVLGYWLMADSEELLSSDLGVAFVVFGDLLTNVQARNNYADAPRVLYPFSFYPEFMIAMLNVVLPCVVGYLKTVASLKKDVIAPSSSPRDKRIWPVVLCAIITVAFFVVVWLFSSGILPLSSSYPMPSPSPRTSSAKSVTATPRLNASSITNVVIPSPKPTETLNPHPMYNGRIVVSTSYERVCPLTVHAGSSSGYYYVFLDYACPPISTTEYRKVMKHASPPYEADIAFLVKAGQSVTIDVPIGVYKFYYATGSTFYGPKYLFGDSTHCYKADDLLTFNATSNYYNGHTITLYATVGGNFDTDDIPDSQFPTK